MTEAKFQTIEDYMRNGGFMMVKIQIVASFYVVTAISEESNCRILVLCHSEDASKVCSYETLVIPNGMHGIIIQETMSVI
jgi:hypothetical protein